jgi:hypothetical protein
MPYQEQYEETEITPQEQQQEEVYQPTAQNIFLPPSQKKADSDFSKWQLDADESIRKIGFHLMGYMFERDTNGKEIIIPPEQSGIEPTLNKAGATEVMIGLFPIKDKNVFLSFIEKADTYRFMRYVIGDIVIRLSSDPARFGITGKDGVNDVTKLYKVKDTVEAGMLAAFNRSNQWKTLSTLNESHNVHEVSQHTSSQQGGWSIFRKNPNR